LFSKHNGSCFTTVQFLANGLLSYFHN
jgi:hypothetical protein